MTKTVTLMLLAVIGCIAMSMPAAAQSKPRWVSRGVKSLNQQRSNSTYSFVIINTHDTDLAKLKNKRSQGIEDYLIETYGAQPFSFESEVYSTDPIIYKITYKGSDGEEYRVVARLVDEYDEFDDFDLNAFQFEFYQLYAISAPNVTPVYDDFSITRRYAVAEKCLGLVPGLSQIYKCQETKGYVIIGGEIFFVGAALYFDWQRRDCAKMKTKEPYFRGSWRSKEIAWRNFEIGSIACAGALYIYNVIDAFRSKGASQVVVKKNPAAVSYSLAPYFSPRDSGVSLVVNF